MPYNGETSVFRISELLNTEIWDIGIKEVVKEEQGKSLIGRADVLTSIVTGNGLEVIPQEPPPRHANIVGWPDEKSEQKQIAMELAAEAQFYKRDYN
jgi:hypothetical protein